MVYVALIAAVAHLPLAAKPILHLSEHSFDAEWAGGVKYPRCTSTALSRRQNKGILTLGTVGSSGRSQGRTMIVCAPSLSRSVTPCSETEPHHGK
jgi:hypothetical protein